MNTSMRSSRVGAISQFCRSPICTQPLTVTPERCSLEGKPSAQHLPPPSLIARTHLYSVGKSATRVAGRAPVNIAMAHTRSACGMGRGQATQHFSNHFTLRTAGQPRSGFGKELNNQKGCSTTPPHIRQSNDASRPHASPWSPPRTCASHAAAALCSLKSSHSG